MSVGEGLKILLNQKKEKKKMGNKFCVLELKPLILNNYYLTQLVPFPMYCHILCIRDSRLNRPESISLASLAKPLMLNNSYLTQLVPFPMYCHILCIRDSRLNRPESISLASLACKWESERQLYLFVLLYHVIMK